MCFIGHGAFGIITKPIWCNYFGVFGFSHATSYHLMPVVGIMDILFGIMMLLYPARAIPLWLIAWGFFTAALRPLSGEPIAEFVERAGNFGAPLTLLLFTGGFKANLRNAITPVNYNYQPNDAQFATALTGLRMFAFLLLAGHGWLNIIDKKSLLDQYVSLGFHNPIQTASIVGLLEIVAALVVLIRPNKYLLFTLLIWKMSSELFYPHHELFEWIERGGSYGVLMALWLCYHYRANSTDARKYHTSFS